jgi:UDP-N-acetylmuramyl pentapeptide phosphotransferase/UDP-N-acetylglucosamine-1-phosphate transferase
LPITIRLAVQIFAVTYVLQATPASVVYFGGFLPPVWDLLFAGILWLWFINLFNFMDGIDGIAGVETISIGCGISGVVLLAGLSPALGWLSLIFISATIGFLWWNWHPAKIFLGDVGSIPLGFIFGWLLLMLAAEGQWPAAVILSLYYLTDATLTLLSRALRGQKIWQAHKKHFYQRAVQRGLSHAHVSTVVLIGNAGLIFCRKPMPPPPVFTNGPVIGPSGDTTSRLLPVRQTFRREKFSRAIGTGGIKSKTCPVFAWCA